MVEIDFPPEEQLDGVSDMIVFPAVVDGRRVRCAIEIEALQETFHADLGDPMPAFHANRPVIEEAAARLIGGGRLSGRGTVLVTAPDL
jgi:hypothetical protein